MYIKRFFCLALLHISVTYLTSNGRKVTVMSSFSNLSTCKRAAPNTGTLVSRLVEMTCRLRKQSTCNLLARHLQWGEMFYMCYNCSVVCLEMWVVFYQYTLNVFFQLLMLFIDCSIFVYSLYYVFIDDEQVEVFFYLYCFIM